MEREVKFQHLCLPDLPGYLLSSPTQNPLRKILAPDLSALHIFLFPLKTDLIDA